MSLRIIRTGDGAVVALVGTRKGRSAGCRIRDPGAGGSRAGLANHDGIQRQLMRIGAVIRWQATLAIVDVLIKVAYKRLPLAYRHVRHKRTSEAGPNPSLTMKMTLRTGSFWAACRPEK